MSKAMNDILNNPPKGSMAWSENNNNEDNNYQKGTEKSVMQSAENATDNSPIKSAKNPQQEDTKKGENVKTYKPNLSDKNHLSVKDMFLMNATADDNSGIIEEQSTQQEDTIKETEQRIVGNIPNDNSQVQKVSEDTNNPKQQEKKTLSYSELYELLNPKPDEEKHKKEANRARANNAIAALGDGISALANIHFTTKGAPNMYDGKNTLTAKTQARYDKLLKDYEENLEKYRQGRLKAEQMDREWDYRTERDKVGDEQFAQNQQRLKDESERQQNNWDKTFEENKRQFDENLKRLKDQADKEFEERKRVNNSTINRNNYYINGGKNGKSKDPEYMPFTSSNKETNVSIRKDVWESNWPYLFGIIVNEGYDMNDFLTKNLFENMDDKQKETFVKQHWEDSDMARGYMKRMSEIYPNDEFNKEYNNSDNDDTAPYLMK